MFELVTEAEPKPVIFNELSQFDQFFLLAEAYKEKDFHDCPGHQWNLAIEYGDLAIYCRVCDGGYYYIQPDYDDHVCLDVPIFNIEWTGREYDSYYSKEYDEWLEVTI